MSLTGESPTSPIARMPTLHTPSSKEAFVREHDNQLPSPSFPPLTPQGELRTPDGSRKDAESFEPTQVVEPLHPAIPAPKEPATEPANAVASADNTPQAGGQRDIAGEKGKGAAALHEPAATGSPTPPISDGKPEQDTELEESHGQSPSLVASSIRPRSFPTTNFKRLTSTSSPKATVAKAGAKKSIYQGGLYWKRLD